VDGELDEQDAPVIKLPDTFEELPRVYLLNIKKIPDLGDIIGGALESFQASQNYYFIPPEFLKGPPIQRVRPRALSHYVSISPKSEIQLYNHHKNAINFFSWRV